MNRLAQFLHYAPRVFALRTLLRGLRDRRPDPRIPTTPVLVSLLRGVGLRVPSYLDLAGPTHRRRWRHLGGLKGPISDDTCEHATERLNLDDVRRGLVCAAKTLKTNQALEGCHINGWLFLSRDANEPFPRRSRCCPFGGQCQIEETDAQGPKHRVTEYDLVADAS